MRYSARDISLAGLFGALGITVPLLFHVIPNAGPMFLPMYLPIMLCALLVAPPVALAVGLVTPLISSGITGMPPFVPTALLMSIELAVMAACASVFYRKLHAPLIPAMILAMVAGRLVAGLERFAIAPMLDMKQSLVVYLLAPVIEGWPGIALQLVVIPIVMAAASRVTGAGDHRRPTDDRRPSLDDQQPSLKE